MVCTRACHLSLSWARSIQSIPPIPLPKDPSEYYPIYACVFQVVSFPQVSPPKPYMRPSGVQYAHKSTEGAADWIIFIDSPQNWKGAQYTALVSMVITCKKKYYMFHGVVRENTVESTENGSY